LTQEGGVKLTCVQLEMEAGDVGVVVRMAGDWLSGKGAPAVERPVEARAMKALPAAAVVKKAKRKNKPRMDTDGHGSNKAEGQAEARPTLTMADFLRAALKTKPMDLSECVATCSAQGYATDSKKCYQVLAYLRSRNDIYREDNDGKWHRKS